MRKLLAAAAMCLATTASAAPLFTFDPTALNAGFPAPFQADFITGNSSSLTTPTGGGSASGTGFLNFSAFVLNGSNLLAGTTGLNSNYQIFATYDYTLHLNSGTLFANNSTYVFDSINFHFYVDPTIGSPTTFTQATTAGAAPVVTLGAGAQEFATASLISGVADINGAGGVGINTSENFVLNALGQSLFTDPNPFYNMSFTEFNNTSTGKTVGPGNSFLVNNQTTGAVDFALVPEPSVLALVGLGLLSFGLARRRKI